MADLGAVGTLISKRLSTRMRSEEYLVQRSSYSPKAILSGNQAFCTYYEQNLKRLGGSTRNLLFPVSREIRVLHRGTGSVVARTHSQPDGSFMVSVPPDMTLDVHILAEPEDGCDAYLPNRTPV